MALRCVLLDVDGTLVDSNDAHAQAWVEALARHGLNVPYPKVRKRIGMGADKLLPEVAGISAEDEEGQGICKSREELFKTRFLPSLRPFPKARELLLRMRQSGLMLVVASSAKNDELDALLELCGANELIKARASSDDAGRSKPDPDIVEVALRKAEVGAGKAVMLGDTPFDLQSATQAGVPLIAVRCGGWQDADFAGALAIYDDPADLLSHYDSSPLQGLRSTTEFRH